MSPLRVRVSAFKCFFREFFTGSIRAEKGVHFGSLEPVVCLTQSPQPSVQEHTLHYLGSCSGGLFKLP